MKSRLPRAGFGVLFTAALLLPPLSPCLAQPKSGLKPLVELDPVEGRKQAAELVDNLRRIKPTQDMTQTLVFKITDRDDRDSQVSVRFEIVCTPTNFLNVYQTVPPGDSSRGTKLTIVHTLSQPNEYWICDPADAPARKLAAGELSLPFAGSDFCAADLGLDFLYWPEQRVTRREMKRSVFCQKLESTDPRPVPGGYSKVVSWVGANRPDELVLVRAEAYDAKGKLLKVFEPTKLEKVNGVQELEEMIIWNRQAGTRTKIEFKFDDRRAGAATRR
ncbi:MAG TPA: outer membrane lipoprotein-sorting protein [Verrucomicrobiae bacterium]